MHLHIPGSAASFAKASFPGNPHSDSLSTHSSSASPSCLRKRKYCVWDMFLRPLCSPLVSRSRASPAGVTCILLALSWFKRFARRASRSFLVRSSVCSRVSSVRLLPRRSTRLVEDCPEKKGIASSWKLTAESKPAGTTRLIERGPCWTFRKFSRLFPGTDLRYFKAQKASLA